MHFLRSDPAMQRHIQEARRPGSFPLVGWLNFWYYSHGTGTALKLQGVQKDKISVPAEGM